MPQAAQQQLFQQLHPVANQILQVFLENKSEESTNAFTMFLLNFTFSDNTMMSSTLSNQTEIVVKGRALEAFAHWVQTKSRDLDQMVPLAQAGMNFVAERLQNCKRQLQQESFQSDAKGVLAEFVYSIVVNMLGGDSACLANALAGIVSAQEESLQVTDQPAAFISLLVRKLEEIQAKVSKVVMELYNDSNFFAIEDSKSLLMQFFRYYTVQTKSGRLEVHESCTDSGFVDSPFRVKLVDSFGHLMELLEHLEDICFKNGHDVVLGVDFEGVKLCRAGELCLIQMTCSDDPRTVYVLDIYSLGHRAFSLATSHGLTLKSILEDRAIRKVWFDPRNDVDALYHQFGIMPEAIFDLQLAEVADRRARGLPVQYVQGLQKCLNNCPSLDSEQKNFADKINKLGKQLFEPNCGGDYEIFRRRPLHPVILVYSAHDSRYMLLLYQHYLGAIPQEWVQRVLDGGDQRARWCLHVEYVVPNSDAPDF